MSYKIKTLKPFEKFYSKRNEKEKGIIKAKFELLKQDPYDSRHLDIKKLKGFDNRYRLRIWDYRIIYEIYDDILIVLVVEGDNRGDIYK